MPRRPAGSITHEVLYDNTEYVQEKREVDEIKKGSANLTSGTINIYRVGGRGQDCKETWQRVVRVGQGKAEENNDKEERERKTLGFPGGSDGKEPACSEGDLGSIPRLGRSLGEGKGYPLQYSGLENSIDCTVHGVTKSQTRLSDFPLCLREKRPVQDPVPLSLSSETSRT